MNKRGQEITWNGLIIAFFTIILLGIVVIYVRQILAPYPTCPVCDYSSYQTNLSLCNNLTKNLSEELAERPIVNNTIYLESPPEYKSLPKMDIILSYTSIVTWFLAVFLSFKFHLFKIKGVLKIDVNLSEELKKELDKFKKVIKWIKWILVGLSVILVAKLVIIIFFI